MTRSTLLLVAAGLALTATPACSDGSPTSPDSPSLQVVTTDGVHLLTQNVVPEVSMEALYEGPLTIDETGCIRLDGPNEHTVVWPLGYTFDPGSATVRDVGGDAVGQVDSDTFQLGGGEVQSLHDGMGFSDADRSLAAERCPGRYWIVS